MHRSIVIEQKNEQLRTRSEAPSEESGSKIVL